MSPLSTPNMPQEYMFDGVLEISMVDVGTVPILPVVKDLR